MLMLCVCVCVCVYTRIGKNPKMQMRTNMRNLFFCQMSSSGATVVPSGSTVLLSTVSVTFGQPVLEGMKWKIPEINNS